MKWKELFTHVFLINLPARKDRLSMSDKILSDAGIDYSLWDATEDEVGMKGLVLTMKAMFYHILTHTDIQNCIILEDDCNFVLPINEFLDILAEQIPKDYHCLYLGCTLTSRPERYSENLLRVNTTYCTQAICYSRKAIELIYPMLDYIEPYDIKLMKHINSLGKCYCTYPMFCEQFPGYSDIEKKNMNWPEYQRITYATYTKGI